jgi:mono/diheme cytochrome c family protein
MPDWLMVRAVVLMAWATLVGEVRADEAPQYNRDIRPIFAENCFRCHGPDSAARKADLRLDQREAAIKANAFKPGKPEESELVRRIFSGDAEEVMPPPAAHKQITSQQKELLKQWIAAGAEYQPHWSLIVPQRAELPVVKNEAWVRTPIDRFVLAKLEALGLSPAPEADRRILARRVSLDLTGLPPQPAEVEQFVRDPASDAYEKFVDRLLALPAWGEHRARYWLDLARYADTNGIHFDNFRENWAYRDYVIQAFNQNLPFDQFTIEQLAGDLLPDRKLEQQVASSFNRCNMTTNEGGAINEEYLVLYTRDRTETAGQTWLGLTVGCAVCHDHKFDPLSQKEFYELSAFFNNTTQAAMDGNLKDTPPVVVVPQLQDRARWQALAEQLIELRKQQSDRRQVARSVFDDWLAGGADEAVSLIPTDGLVFQAPYDTGSSSSVDLLVDGQSKSATVAGANEWGPGHVGAHAIKVQPEAIIEVADAGNFERDKPFTYAAWVKLTKKGQSGAVFARMDDGHEYRGWDLWIENGRLAAHLIHQWDQNAIKVATEAELKVGQWNHLVVSYDGSSKAAGLKFYVNGERQKSKVLVDRLTDSIQNDVPLKIGQRDSESMLEESLIDDVRIYGRVLPESEIKHLVNDTRAAWLAAKPADLRNEAESKELFEWWLLNIDKPTQKMLAELAEVEQEQKRIKSRSTVAHVMQERDEQPAAYILNRGEYDQRRDRVSAGTPALLPPMPADLPRNRLGFAKWLLLPENPLTARVTVNRFWQEVFGTGIVRTAGDFGVNGELPSHPELLDWLAIDFRESGWDVKRLFRMLVTSAAYRQAATVTPQKLTIDPQNRWLSRGPRYRMDAEMIRDFALSASGLLVTKIGGPSVRPYQPPGVWEAVAMRESNTREYVQDHGENLYRRSLYTFWKRAAPPASMEVLNAPSRETCTIRRERTDTPLQALVTLNDPQFVEAARQLAQTAVLTDDSVDRRLQLVAERLLSRSLRAEEITLIKSSLIDSLSYYAAHFADAEKLISVGESKADPKAPPAVLAAWTVVVNELLNLDEVLNK